MQVPSSERKCPQCGKMFFLDDPTQWAYKRLIKGHKKFFCSWSCVRAYDRKQEEKRLKAKREKWEAKCKRNAERDS